MKIRAWTTRTPGFPIFLLSAFALGFAACGGGGATVGKTAGSAEVRVSLASTSAPATPTVLGPASSAPDALKPEPSPSVDNLFITIERVALIPGDDGDCDPEGEKPFEYANGRVSAGEPEGFVGVDLDNAVRVDLLDLPNGFAARLLNVFDNVPAGEYGKIRIYYSDPEAWIGGESRSVHATANYHLDIHFKGGNLVIPVTTNPPAVRIHNVTITFVLGKDGLKVNVLPNGKVLFRPQVFATVVEGEVEYVVSGTAENVDKAQGTFDLRTAPFDNRVFAVEYSGSTSWFFREDARFVEAGASRGIPALDNGTAVDVLGTFAGSGFDDPEAVLSANAVLITFPDVLEGEVNDGWLPDNTFVLRFPGDNVVIPQPDRATAYYDNLATGAPLTNGDQAIQDNVWVKARGYSVPGTGIRAFWISVGEAVSLAP